MRLHPELTEEEAFAWLKEQAKRDDPSEWTDDLEANLQAFARAMAAISLANVPDELVPLFP